MNLNQGNISFLIYIRRESELIEGLIKTLNKNNRWNDEKEKEFKKDLLTLIVEENLKENQTTLFLRNSFLNGYINKLGMDIVNLMPPVSYFNPDRENIKNRVTFKLEGFFDKYYRLWKGV